jgi:hypothetical protein
MSTIFKMLISNLEYLLNYITDCDNHCGNKSENKNHSWNCEDSNSIANDNMVKYGGILQDTYSKID